MMLPLLKCLDPPSDHVAWLVGDESLHRSLLLGQAHTLYLPTLVSIDQSNYFQYPILC